MVRRQDISHGMRVGMLYAFLGIGLAALRIRLLGHGLAREELVVLVGVAVSLGLAGGFAFGALRPLRSRWWGKLVTAFVILFMLHSMAAFFLKDVSLPMVLATAAVLSALLAPLYVGVAYLVDKYTGG